jgi:hypothetical protein
MLLALDSNDYSWRMSGEPSEALDGTTMNCQISVYFVSIRGPGCGI